MAGKDDIPPAIQEAFDHLVASGIAQIVEELRPATARRWLGDAEFSCQVHVPQPNKADIPPLVELRVAIPATFPLARIDVFPVDCTVRGFPHQDAETGKLCLQPSSNAPWDITRLKCYLEWAAAWLRDAARGTLLAAGDPYELPDFSRRKLKLPFDFPLFFDETAANFQVWRQWVGCTGAVRLKILKAPKALVPVSFRLPDDHGDYEPAFADVLLETPVLRGRWLLLPDIRALHHRPPQTYEELRKLCEGSDIGLDDVLREAWNEDNQAFNCGLLLVGFPIPRFVGQQPSEIHWQPLVIETWRQDKRRKTFRKQSRRKLFEQVTLRDKLAPNRSLPWGKCTNIAGERLYARGGCDESLQSVKTAVCGCGALGSVVCELLVRGGVSHLSMFDSDTVEVGNLCRHTLNGADVGRSKARALAHRLSTTNPLANIQGYCVGFPLPPTIPKDLTKARDRLLDSDLFIDCTTDEGAFIWLSELARTHRKRLVSLFFNFGATVLTLCSSGKHTPCAKVCRRLYQDVSSGKTPVSPGEWDPEPTSNEFVIPGAGCWHPTFPAANRHVWMLAAAAVDVLSQTLPKPPQTDGLGVLIRRNNVVDDDASPKPLVEITWMKAYR